MAAPVIASTTSAVVDGPSSISCNKPAGTASGDVLYASICCYLSDSITVSTPAGWTLVRGPDRRTGSAQIAGYLFRKVAGGSEPASYTFTASQGTYLTAWIARVTGADTTTPEDASTSGNNGTGSPRTGLGVTTSGSDRLLLLCSLGFGVAPNATPSGMTQVEIVDTVTGYYSQTIASAGATGDRSHTQNSGADPTWVTQMVAIAPAASGSSIAPGAGSLAYTGYAPTLATVSSTAPGAGGLTYTGYAPTIGNISTVAPGPGSLAYTGYAPSLITPSAVAPGAGSLAFTGYAPSLVIPSAVAPGAGSLTYTGYQPILGYDSTVSPGAGSLTYTGYAPSVGTSTSISPGADSLAYTGYAPVIGTTIGPGRGALAYTGYQPTLQGVPLDIDLIPVVNNLEQLRKHANRILQHLIDLRPQYGPDLPTVDADLDGRLFVKTSDQTLYQQQYGAWVAVDMVP